MCHILLDNVSMDDVIKVFGSHKIFNDDDLAVMLLAPSEYLKKQVLLECLHRLRLAMWLMICDILESIKSVRYIGIQLRNGMEI